MALVDTLSVFKLSVFIEVYHVLYSIQSTIYASDSVNKVDTSIVLYYFTQPAPSI